MAFSYTASTKEGKVVRGMSLLADRDLVIRDLESKGFLVISVDEKRILKRVFQAGALVLGTVGHLEKVLFTKHLALMLKAGLSLAESLRILEEQASSWRFKAILRQLTRKVEGGGSLSNALEAHPKVFSPFFINIVHAGELAGTLVENLEHLAQQFNKEHELRKKVKSATLYPIIVISAAVLIGFYFAVFVIPQIANLFAGLPGVKLPWVTRVLLAAANILKKYTFTSLFGFLGAIIFILWFLRRRFLAPVTHALILRLPAFGKIAKDVNLARFSLVLGTLLKSGINITQATEVTSAVVGNFYYKKALAQAVIELQRGNPLANALAASPDIFPKIAARMVYIGEQTGKLEDVLGYLAEFYELEVDTAMRNLSTILEPILLLIIGGFALGLAYAILIPIYNFVSAIRRI